MANSLNFNQCSTLLASITAQATGRASLTPTNTSEFVSVANTALLSGYDNLINAISQVLSKTIFSVRPYSRKFAGIYADSQRYGNHVRKLQMVDSNPEDDDRQKLEHGKSVDQQMVKKPEVLQTNFYGANVYQRCVTLFKDQLDVAFSSPEEFGRFIGMVVQNVSDQIEKDHEECARATLANFIAGKVKCDPANVVHLVTEFNASSDTANVQSIEEIRNSGLYANFMKFALARIESVSEFMTERSTLYHVNIDNKPLARHTPKNKQKVYLHSKEMTHAKTTTFSTVFHDEYLKKVDYEPVNFWQSIKEPDKISCAPSYIDSTGALVKGENTVVNNVFGVIFDEEALGYTTVNAWSASAPFNAKGGYTNTFWHFTDRYWNDFTENGVVLLLD